MWKSQSIHVHFTWFYLNIELLWIIWGNERPQSSSIALINIDSLWGLLLGHISRFAHWWIHFQQILEMDTYRDDVHANTSCGINSSILYYSSFSSTWQLPVTSLYQALYEGWKLHMITPIEARYHDRFMIDNYPYRYYWSLLYSIRCFQNSLNRSVSHSVSTTALSGHMHRLLWKKENSWTSSTETGMTLSWPLIMIAIILGRYISLNCLHV